MNVVFTINSLGMKSLPPSLQHLGTDPLNPLDCEDDVISWSKNCPHCIRRWVILGLSTFSLAWTMALISRAEGSLDPKTEILGA